MIWTDECERLWRNALDQLALAIDLQILTEMEKSVPRRPPRGPIAVEGSLILRPGDLFAVVPVWTRWPSILIPGEDSGASFWLKGVEYKW